MIRAVAVALLPVLLAGCIPARRGVPAAATVAPPAAWTERSAAPDRVDARWWQAFGDPVLDQLVARALANNTDVLTAAARVDEARGNLALARAALRPAIDADASVARARQLGDFGVTESSSIQPEATLSWQLDLFGRLRAQKRAARYQFVASQADRDGAALSVASQVVQGYFALLSLDTQLIVTRETVTTRLESLRLAEDQARVGYASQFELTQAQSEYQSVVGQVPELLRGIRNAENALTLLTGDAPGAPFARGRLQDLKTPGVPATLPSDLLHRRPDIVASELQLAAADASLTASRRAFLPSVSISGSLGQLFVDGLSFNPVTVWQIGGSVLAPIFEGGRLRANVDVSTAQRDEAAYAYRGSVLTAFQDVENALTNVRRYGEQIAIVKERRATLQRSVVLATDRYRGGYATYLDQLDAQRNLYSTELEAISIRQSQLDAIVQLAVAYGGGWEAPASAMPRPE